MPPILAALGVGGGTAAGAGAAGAGTAAGAGAGLAGATGVGGSTLAIPTLTSAGGGSFVPAAAGGSSFLGSLGTGATNFGSGFQQGGMNALGLGGSPNFAAGFNPQTLGYLGGRFVGSQLFGGGQQGQGQDISGILQQIQQLRQQRAPQGLPAKPMGFKG